MSLQLKFKSWLIVLWKVHEVGIAKAATFNKAAKVINSQ